MQAGRIFFADQWQMRLVFSASELPGSFSSVAGRCLTHVVTLDPLGNRIVAPGVTLGARAYWLNDAPLRGFRVRIPALGYDAEVTRSGFGGGSMQIEFDNLEVLLARQGDAFVWRTTGTAWRWRLGGQVQFAGGAFSTESPPNLIVPLAIPLIGVPAILECLATSWPLSGEEAPAGEIGFDASSTGGWRYRQGSTWIAPPVNLQIDAPPCGCPVCAPLPRTGAPTTWDGFVEARYRGLGDSVAPDCWTGVQCVQCPCCFEQGSGNFPVTWSSLRSIGESSSGRLMLVPDLPRRVRRGNADYAALIARGGFPRAVTWQWSECYDTPRFGLCDTPNPPRVDERFLSTYAAQSEFLDAVTADRSVIEDPFAAPIRAPYDVGGRKWDNYSFFNLQIGPCSGERAQISPCGEECLCAIDPGFFERIHSAFSLFPLTQRQVDNPAMIPMLSVEPPLDDWVSHAVRYVGFWAHPHWSSFYWFPPEEAADSVKWKIEGASVEAEPYWLPLRTQHIAHPALPPERNRRTRTSVLSAPLQTGGLSAFLRDFFFGVRTSWWGIGRFGQDRPVLPRDVSLGPTSAPSWSFENATATFGAVGIELSPTGTPVKATLDLGRFLDPPFLAGHLADRLTVDWASGNLASARARLVSADGTRVDLASAPGTYRRPVGRDVTYAGSWGQDFGVGLVNDLGVDELGSGRSAEAMADRERNLALSLLAGRGAQSLEFELTPIDLNHPLTLRYPVLRIAAGAWTLAETGQTSLLIWPDGPALRWGQLSYWNHGFADPPVLRGIGSARSALDWLAFRRPAFEGAVSTTGLTDEIAARYTVTETGVDRLAGLAADTVAFLTPGQGLVRAVLVNSLAEVPPLIAFPGRSRDDQLEATGPLALESWSWAVEPRRFVAPTPAPTLRRRATSEIWSEADFAPSGWGVSRHARAVDGGEAGEFEIVHGRRALARVSPWHGYLAISPPVAPAMKGPRYDVSPAMRHAIGTVEGGKLAIATAANAARPSFAFRITAIDADDVSLAWDRADRRGRLHVLAASGGQITLRATLDEGQTWTMPITIDTGTHPALLISRHNARYLYWYRNGKIYGQIRDSTGALLSGSFEAISAADDAAIDAQEFTVGQGKWQIGLVYVADGQVRFASSRDGRTFT